MKKLIYLIIILTAFLTTSIIARPCNMPPDVENCYENGHCNDPSGWTTTTYVIYLPDWPNCPISVTYAYRQCEDGAKVVDMYLCNYTIINCFNCQALIDYLSVTNTQELAHNAAYVKQQIEINLVFELFNIMWAGLDSQQKEQYYYPEGINQNDPDSENWRIKYYYYTSVCQSFCRTLIPNGQSTAIVITPIKCAEDGCCMMKIQYCVDRNTGQIIKNISFENIQSVYCSAVTPPVELCPPGVENIIMPCNNNCNLLELEY